MSDTYAVAYEIGPTGETVDPLAVGVLARSDLVVFRPEPGVDENFPRQLRAGADAWMEVHSPGPGRPGSPYQVRLALGSKTERLESTDAVVYFGAAQNSRWSAFSLLPNASRLPVSSRFGQGTITARQLRDLATSPSSVRRSELRWRPPARPADFRIEDPSGSVSVDVEVGQGRVVVKAQFNPCKWVGCPWYCTC